MEKVVPEHWGAVICFWHLGTEGEAKSSGARWGRGESRTPWASEYQIQNPHPSLAVGGGGVG